MYENTYPDSTEGQYIGYYATSKVDNARVIIGEGKKENIRVIPKNQCVGRITGRAIRIEGMRYNQVQFLNPNAMGNAWGAICEAEFTLTEKQPQVQQTNNSTTKMMIMVGLAIASAFFLKKK